MNTRSLKNNWTIKAPVLGNYRERHNLIRIPEGHYLKRRVHVEMNTPMPLKMAMVINESPESYKEALKELGYYFRRECSYAFCGYEPNDCGRKASLYVRGFIFTNMDEYNLRALGGTVFRKKKDYKTGEEIWVMQWIWFHPYIRCKGRLKEAWPFFKEMFGDFVVDRPHSNSMKGFLENIKEV